MKKFLVVLLLSTALTAGVPYRYKLTVTNTGTFIQIYNPHNVAITCYMDLSIGFKTGVVIYPRTWSRFYYAPADPTRIDCR